MDLAAFRASLARRSFMRRRLRAGDGDRDVAGSKIFRGRPLGLQEYNDVGVLAIADWIRNLPPNPNPVIENSKGHFDSAEYERQLKESVN